jgi:tetratricopeptide (TPR) repeat protein
MHAIIRSAVILLVVAWSALARDVSIQREATQEGLAAHAQAGQQALKAGRYEEAVKEYEEVIRLDPSLVEARANLGLGYHMLGQYKTAVEQFEKALQASPALLGANLFAGIDYLKLGLPAKALPVLKRALRQDPSNLETRRALAACYTAQDNYREAAQQFRMIASVETDRSQAWYELGQNYLVLAKRLGNVMARLHQSSAWADRLAGDLFTERRLWADALIKYQQGIERAPTQQGLNASLGAALLHMGKMEQAEAAFRAELTRDPYNERGLLGLAELYLARGDAVKAVESISKIWASFPPFLGQQVDFPSISIELGTANKLIDDLEKAPLMPARDFILAGLYRTVGQGEKARERWAGLEQLLWRWQGKLVERDDHTNVRQLCEAHQYAACAKTLERQKHRDPAKAPMLGRALFALGHYEPAADAIATGLASEKGNVEAVYWLIRAYMRLADTCFDRLMEHFPDSWRVHQVRGDIQKQRTVYKQAIKEYEAAARLRPEEPEIHEALGEAYLLDQAWRQAEAELKEALQLDRARARSLYLLGRVYLGEHEEQKSIPYFETALRYDPGVEEAHAGLGQAYMRIGDATRAVPELKQAMLLDYYGDLHHLLYLAYSKLGQPALAQEALARSQELRRKSAATHQARVAEAMEVIQQ